MPLTRLDNLYSSKTGKYLYVSPDDFNATDELDNRGNSPLRPFKTIQRAFIEVSRYSYLPGKDNDRFDQFSIMLMPGNHYIDNRPGLVDAANPEVRYFDAANLIEANKQAIIDRGAADIAVHHPDFYYPGDVQTADYSRYKDAFRLTQLNRQEIINSSWDSTLTQYPSHGQYEDKCKRDLGLFIDSISLDVAQADGNVYTRKFLQTFFNAAGNAWGDATIDGEQDEAKFAFEKARDNIYLAISNQLSAQDLTITADNAPGSDFGTNTQTWTPSGATYTPTDGKLTLEIASHGLSVGDYVNIASGSIVFTCDQDNNQSNHAYPRLNDPAAGKYLRVDEVATNSITVNVGATPIVNYTPTDATYDPATGDLVLTIGTHNLSLNETVKIAEDSLVFTCAMDSGSTTHAYPRQTDPVWDTAIAITNVGSSHTAQTGTEYNPTTGVLTLNIPSHGFSNGDQVKLNENAVTFTCAKDGNATNHSYPRPTDPSSDTWLSISNVTTDTFDVQVGVSPEVAYNVSSATYAPTTGHLTLDIGNHNFSGPTTRTATDATFNAANGTLQLTVADHGYIDGDRVKIEDGSLSFTCDMDGNNSSHAYPRATDPASGQFLPISNITNDTFEINVGSTPTVNYTPSNATYDPTTGLLVLTIGTHGLEVGTSVKIAQDGLTFTCDMDANATNHTYPRQTDPIFADGTDIVTVGSTSHTVTGSNYDPTSGVLSLTVNNHGFSNGEKILLTDNSVTFTCAKDNNATQHTYPRATDDVSGQWIEISNVQTNTFDVQVGISPDISAHTFVSGTTDGLKHQDGTITLNVGTSPLVSYNVTDATFTPSTGNLVLDIGPHTLRQGTSIMLDNESLVFTCAADSNQTQHAYPRQSGQGGATADDPAWNTSVTVADVGETSHQPEAGTGYSPTTGILTVNLAGHGFSNGDRVKFDDNSLTFTCEKDGNATQHTYPRSTDPVSGDWLEISNVQTDSFNVDIGTSYNTSNHVFVSAAAASLKHQTGLITVNVGVSSDTSAHTFVSANSGAVRTGGSYNHTFVTAAADSLITGGQYDHTFVSATPSGVVKAGDSIKIGANTLRFTCAYNGHSSQHSYPRTSDPAYDTQLPIVSTTPTEVVVDVGISPDTSQHIFVGADAGAVTSGGNYPHSFVSGAADAITRQDGTITLNVGASPTVTHDVTNATYNPNTGDLVLDIGAHSLTENTSIRLASESITFTCAADNDQTNHAYPRPNGTGGATADDPAYNTAVNITAVSGNTITINVGASSDTSAHTFVSATAGAVISGGNHLHTFSSAVSGALITGGNYGHTFVSSTADSVTFASNINNRANSALCSDVQSYIANLTSIVTQTITDGDLLTNFPAEQVSAKVPAGEEKCKRDIGYYIDAIVADLRNGGNSNIISTTKTYFDREGNPIADGIVGEVAESVTAMNGARDMINKAVSNQLYSKDEEVTQGPSIAGQTTPVIDSYGSGNPQACADVQSSVITLTNIITSTLTAGNLNNLTSVQITGTVPIFDYNQALEEWQDDSILDLSNPDNVLYKFNASTGGAIVPRGCSLIGYDLRRTIVRPLYVPDCIDGDVGRSALFCLTGGCYLWQMTYKDGDLSTNSPLYDQADNVGKVYNKPNDFTSLAIPEYSHHKLTVMTYAGNEELDRYYEKVGRAFAQFQPTIDDGELEALVQETRIVGPLSDSRSIESIEPNDINAGSTCELTVKTKIDHGYFVGQYVAVLNTGLSTEINGTFKVTWIDSSNPKVFKYQIPTNSAGLGLVAGTIYTTANNLSTGAVIQAEIDSVESASPYVFNCSIRSTWGICGMWADGSKVTGFKSMVVAQYTGVSLQKDDRAFIRYDRFNNTWNQASLQDSFATVPYHTKGDAYWKDDWRNFHIKCTDDAFIQAVSVFAVGYHNHFLLESGGDMSITNSNSNFGNTSLHSKGFKGFAFNQDKGGYIDAIVPPKIVDSSGTALIKQQYYTIDIEKSNDATNHTRLYLAGDENQNPADRPAANIGGYRIGAKANERLYVNLPKPTVGGKDKYHGSLEPSGWTTYTASLSTLTPADYNPQFDLNADGNSDFNSAQDAASLIERNRDYIASEAYGYILSKYPLLSINPALTIQKCQRDLGFFVDAVVKDLRVGGNINSINIANAYFNATNLNYINNELTETLEAYDYAKKLMLGAMRNFNLLIKDCTVTNNSATVVVGDTSGLVEGMIVREFDSNDFTNGWIDVTTANPVVTNLSSSNIVIDSIVNATTITLKDQSTGSPYLSLGSSTTAWLYFEQVTTYGTSIPLYRDSTITIDAQYPECNNIASVIEGYYDTVNLILSGSSNSITRVEPIITSSSLTGRATVFTVNTGAGQSDPHGWQTGTPVRLVPKAGNTSIDKRLVRLPVGFATNQVYYVIAPGRKTYPKFWDNSSDFDTSASTRLMLASSKENAAAGIYVFSPETDFIDSGVEVEIQQYVLDDSYNLHRYVCNVSGTYIESDIPNIFDKPIANVSAQKIFFSTSSDASSALPEISGGGGGVVPTDVYYYPRYETNTKFSVHPTEADAAAGTNAILFQAGSGNDFLVYGDKKTSPLKYDASTYQRWYLNVKDESTGGVDPNSILTRFHHVSYEDGSGNLFTPDTWFERFEDDRTPDDRIYRLRYVIPEYLENVREPLNGYVVKTRTDDRRRLKPQKFILEPYSNGAPNVAEFHNPGRTTQEEWLGTNYTALDAAGIDVEDRDSMYDPYKNPLVLEFESLIATTVQSARIVKNDALEDRLELTTFDHTILNDSIKNEQFAVIEVSAPQGAGIQSQLIGETADTAVSWAGYSTGSAYVHAYYTAESTAFVVLKSITGKLEWDSGVQTTFTQANGTFWNLSSNPDSWGEVNQKSRSDRNNYLYRVSGANVYTVVPGDRVNDVRGNTYTVLSVEDVPEVEDTFYIFDVETIREFIPRQQPGIYYLTCVRGNVSPYPTGAGVGNNFHNYKFSQPISSLYPLNYKNDPLWFTIADPTAVDPPASIAAADNYVHGYVTLNDNKNSETKEALLDFLATDPLKQYVYTNSTTSPAGDTQDYRIRAQEGNASIGSENRKIPISGDSAYPLEERFYVELRRPSIARSGNHTFEYLGFGPGNYSTGFPVRQEVVLSDKQDFYAQAKREDAGIVFYTGLNSNGDLYIGNKKINAITGEETFLEQAVLQETDDDADKIGVLVTTFDTAVTFNNKITVEGNTYLNNPVRINVDPDEGDALRIYSLVDAAQDDDTLGRQSWRNQDDGDILLTKNEIRGAVFHLNARGNINSPGQPYKVKTHYAAGLPSNITPNQSGMVDVSDTANDSHLGGGTATYVAQAVSYGSAALAPASGDVLFKGREVGSTGSLGWVYANSFKSLSSSQIEKVTANSTTKIVIQWKTGITNGSIGAKVNQFIRFANFSNTYVNGTWKITSAPESSNEAEFYVYNQIPSGVYDWTNEGQGATCEISQSVWKEVGVLGAEALRTLTEQPGDYRLGVNTIGRMAKEGVLDGSTSVDTTPRANLDVVGFAFISGKELVQYDVSGNVIANNYLKDQGNVKTYFPVTNAFLVGGDSATPDSLATLRVATTDVLPTRVTITNPGTGYTAGSVAVSGGSGAGLTVTITVDSNNFVTGITLNADPIGYADGDNLTVTGGGGDATFTLNYPITYVGGGRVGVNTGIGLAAEKELDRNFVVVGNSRITGNVLIEDDLSVDGGDINSTAETFQFLNTSVDYFLGLNTAESITIGNTTTNSQVLNIGNAVPNDKSSTIRVGGNAGTTVFEVHKLSKDAHVDIASVEDVVSSTCTIRIGGAAPNQSSSTYIGTFQTKTAGTLEIGSFPGTSTARLFTTATQVDVFDGASTSRLTLGKNASDLQMGSLGGTTTVRNSLEVLARITGHSHIKLVGGLQAGIIEITRGRFSAGVSSHSIGSLEAPNIDFLKYAETGRKIDTAGQGNWGSDADLLASGQIAAIDSITPASSSSWVANTTYSFLTTVNNSTPTASGALFTVTVDGNGVPSIDLVAAGTGYADNDVLTISGTQLGNPSGDDLTFQVNGVNSSGTVFVLPITQPSPLDFKVGDILLVERGHADSPDTIDGGVTTGLRDQAFNEILKVEGLINVTDPSDTAGFRLAVSRGLDGTVKRTDHPDNTVIAKLDKQPNASYITGFDFNEDGIIDPPSDVEILDANIEKIVGDGTDIAVVHWSTGNTNGSLNIDSGETIKISGVTNAPSTLNGDWVVQTGIVDGEATANIKLGAVLAAGDYLWSAEPTAAELSITSSNSLAPDTADTRIGVAEFGGVLTDADYLLLSDSEIVKVKSLITTDIQSLIVTDGGDPEVENFKVESTTGHTFARGDLKIGQGLNKLTVDGQSGDTTIAGMLTIEDTFTLNGSTIEGSQWFRLTNGGAEGTPLRTTLEVDTATGDLTINGGDIDIFAEDGTTPKLTFENATGDFTTYGSFSALGTGTSTFGGDILTQGDITINGGDLTINSGGTNIFSVENDGALTVSGIENYITQTGGRKWEYSAQPEINAQANTNYFLDVAQNTVVKLPNNPLIGDMIRIVDIGGILTYNMSLVIRAVTGVKVQNTLTNTGTAMLTGNGADLSQHDGGEMIVQTPYAGFALIYVGDTTPNGDSAAPPSKVGWYLLEV